MRIYTVADIHGKSERIELVRSNAAATHSDVLVVAGDITNYFNSAEVIHRLNRIPIPVLAIRGNTDLTKVDHLLDDFPNTTSLHLKAHTSRGVKFVGISGTIPIPFSSRIALREKRIINILRDLVDVDSVLVVHTPPRSVLDDVFGLFHAGCRRLYDLAAQHQPRLLLCGHIHERPGIASIGHTTVVNCSIARAGKGALVDLESDVILQVQLL